MRWIVSSSEEISGDRKQLQSRADFIKMVTSSEVSPWRYMPIGEKKSRHFRYCESSEGISATFITAHIQQVEYICSLKEIMYGSFVVANTCILNQGRDKDILRKMMVYNPFIKLWFAHQEQSMDHKIKFNTLSNLGCFGFMTSASERKLFMYRGLGIKEALEKSFDKVSPILCLGD